jgi:rSAM/selenodomain-associated transferase 1
MPDTVSSSVFTGNAGISNYPAEDTALIVMARYPEAGQTKTRLARSLGAEETAVLYRAFLADLAQRFAEPNLPYQLCWAYTPVHVDFAGLVAEMVPKAGQTMSCFQQQGHDFAARLLYSFQWSAVQGFHRTVLIGSDTPQISRELVADACAALDEADVVLGPALDGGYYLIAMRQPHDVFSNIPMSTDVVLQMTIQLAQRQRLRVHLLPTLFDVDEWSDLLCLAALLELDSALAPVTAAYLHSIRSAIC